MPRTVGSGREPGNRYASSSRRGFRIRASCQFFRLEEKVKTLASKGFRGHHRRLSTHSVGRRARYYISSLGVGVKRFAHAVRSHWGIENSCHWSLDVTYREDESRIREEHLRENFAWLNRLTLSLLKQHPGRESLAMKRRSCGWSDDFLLEVLVGATL